MTLRALQVLRLVLSGAGEVLKADVSGFTSLIDLIPRLREVLERIKERGGQTPQVIYTDNLCCNGRCGCNRQEMALAKALGILVRFAALRYVALRCATLRLSPTCAACELSTHDSPSVCSGAHVPGAPGCHALAQAPERGARLPFRHRLMMPRPLLSSPPLLRNRPRHRLLAVIGCYTELDGKNATRSPNARPLFSTNWAAVWAKEVVHVQNGCLSDPDGIELYQAVSGKFCEGMQVYISRGTGAAAPTRTFPSSRRASLTL